MLNQQPFDGTIELKDVKCSPLNTNNEDLR